jgi:hypothetical protein
MSGAGGAWISDREVVEIFLLVTSRVDGGRLGAGVEDGCFSPSD